jgi:hypothetical protein
VARRRSTPCSLLPYSRVAFDERGKNPSFSDQCHLTGACLARIVSTLPHTEKIMRVQPSMPSCFSSFAMIAISLPRARTTQETSPFR